MISVRFQGKPFNVTVIQAYAPTSNAEEAEIERVYEDLHDLLEWTPKKDVLFIIGDWNAKIGSQEIPGVTGKFGLGVQNEAGQRLIKFCQENTLVIANTLFQQHKRKLYTWTLPDGQYRNQTDYIISSQRWRSSIQSAKTRLGADCGSDHELLIAKFRLKLKKVRKTTRPFRYDLNQIPYDYTVEVRNRFKGLDLIDRVPDELWWRFVTLYRRQGSSPSSALGLNLWSIWWKVCRCLKNCVYCCWVGFRICQLDPVVAYVVQAFRILLDFLSILFYHIINSSSIIVLSDAEKHVLSSHLYCGFVCFLSAQPVLASCIELLMSVHLGSSWLSGGLVLLRLYNVHPCL